MVETRKIVTIVFSDVTGSTQLGERLDAEALRRVMERYFGEMRLVLERHGGTVEKFIGDAVVAVFGIPVAHEDDALRAVKAAIEMRARLTELNDELARERGLTLAVRTGINTGEVVAGDPSSGQFYASGDAVNVAARLEQAAQPGEILLGRGTYQLVRNAVLSKAVDPLALRGKAEAVSAWRLVDVLADVPAFTRRIDAPFVGRHEELSLLVQAFERAAKDGACELVTVVGAPGIGKSRLARELVAVLAMPRVLVGRCLPYGDGITYSPLAEIVRQVAGDGTEKLAKLLAGEEYADVILGRILGAVGLAETEARAEEISWAVRRFFETLARERPLVVILDDLHWAEPTFLDLVEYLASFVDGRVLLLCSARPDLFELRPSWPQPRPRATLVALKPLLEKDAETLVENLMGGSALPEALSGRILEKAEGNPLFVEQMLAFARERSDGDGDLEIPPTMQALLTARIDRLPHGERAVLERAAVEGRHFHRGAVSALLPESERDAVQRHLITLVRKELIRPDRALFPGDDAFRFAHILIRDAAYEATAKELRAELHEAFASWLERTAGAQIGELEEILAYHLEASFRYRVALGPADAAALELATRTGTLLATAGRRAYARGDFPAVVRLLTRASDLLPEENPIRLDLVSDLGHALHETGSLADAEALYVRALDDARRLGRERPALMAAIDLALLRIFTDPASPVASLDEALALAEQAIDVCALAVDEGGLARAWELVHTVHWTRGQLTEAHKAAERGLAHAERAGDLRLQAVLRGSTVAALDFGFAPVEECTAQFEEALEWARATGFLPTEAMGLIALGQLRLEQGRIEEGLSLIARGRELLDELGMPVMKAAMTGAGAFSVGWVAFDPDGAEETIRAAYDTLKSMGEKGTLSTVATNLADVLYLKGTYAEAEALTREAEELGGADDVATEVGWRNARAMLLARRGQHAEAETLAREAVERATATEYMRSIAESHLALAEVLRLAKRPEEAADAISEALRLYEAKGFTLSEQAVRTRLEELQATSPLGERTAPPTP
jgi:class 3 adenylate cyclase/tetratricopeptide (TPR) repeat protein